MINACAVCGKEFKALGTAKCCSAECSHIRRNRTVYKWRRVHPEKARENAQKHYAELSEEQRLRRYDLDHRWKAAHPDVGRRSCRRYYATHLDEERERGREKARVFRVAHLVEMREYERKRYAANPEKRRESVRQSRAAHPERVRESLRKYCTTARGKTAITAARHNRRAKVGAGRMTIETIRDLRAEYGGVCPYCNTMIAKGHIDHIVPVCKGGTNDRNNLVWVCQDCNRQKGTKGLLEFLLYRQGQREAICP